MPFADYDSMDAVARRYGIHCRRDNFIEPIAAQLGGAYREELDLTLSEVAYKRTEWSVCETLIYPLLREVWKPYRAALSLWSHEPIRADDDLCGVPDYIIARRSPLGSIIFDLPFLLVVEAKRDNFERGCGQCLAAMLAAQRMNGGEHIIHGIATNGVSWEFGRLVGSSFVLELTPAALRDLEALASALNYLMVCCRDEAAKRPVTA